MEDGNTTIRLLQAEGTLTIELLILKGDLSERLKDALIAHLRLTLRTMLVKHGPFSFLAEPVPAISSEPKTRISFKIYLVPSENSSSTTPPTT